MLEELLEKISLSTYRENFILKGGMLIANIIGVDSRSTMDMDATISGFELSKETIREMFRQILSVQTSGEIEMELERIEQIHEEDDYAGF